jgi:LacI family transcriptional regulator
MLALHSLELVLGRMQNRLPAGAKTIEVKADFVPRSSCAAPALAVTGKSVTR